MLAGLLELDRWWRSALLALCALGAVSNTPAFADAQQSMAWFTQLTADQRADLQGNLVLLAHYGGMVDGDFGPGTYSALTSWQQSIGYNQTGVLDDHQLEVLEQMASEVMSGMGMGLIDDLGGHLSIMLPTELLTVQKSRQNGTWYEDASGELTVETFWRTSYSGSLAQIYREASTPTIGKTVSYSALRDDLYVVTGLQDGRYYYELVHADGTATAGFRFTYTERFRNIGGVASVFAASYSAPLNVIEAAKESPSGTSTPVTATVEPKLPAPSSVPTTKQKSDGGGVRVFGSFITMEEAPGVLALIGDIGPSTPLDFRRALRSMAKPEVLVLASDGGLVASALMIAYEVHELGLSTYVMPETQCYSACSFIFLAGADRLVEGELGVHQVWGENADASSAQTVVSDILEAFGEFGVR